MAKIKIVCWKDKLGGEIEEVETEAFSYGFTVGPHGEWEMLIAAEDKEVKKDELVPVKIEEIELPPKSIVVPCCIMRHALGIVASLGCVGTQKKVEERRVVNTVVFNPLFDGTVHRGELLCVTNVLYASIDRRLARGTAEKWLQERYRY